MWGQWPLSLGPKSETGGESSKQGEAGSWTGWWGTGEELGSWRGASGPLGVPTSTLGVGHTRGDSRA